MSARQPRNVSYGLSQSLIIEAPYPIASKRSPTANDFATIGTIWSNVTTSTLYILASIVSNAATWIQVTAGGGAGAFTSLTVNPGPVNITATSTLTGPTNINTAGAALTAIGTAAGDVHIGLGTGAVHIGNATGNTFIDDGELAITDGNITIVNATSGYVLPTGCVILSGSGDPNGVAGFAAPIGSLYLNHAPTGTTDRLFVNTDGGTTWAHFTASA